MIKRLGLPGPPKLRRYGRATRSTARSRWPARAGSRPPSRGGSRPPTTTGCAGIVFDATELRKVEDLRDLYEILHPIARSSDLRPGRRPRRRARRGARRRDRRGPAGLEGFVRCVAKEFGRGITAQLDPAASARRRSDLGTTLGFLLSGQSAYVSGR